MNFFEAKIPPPIVMAVFAFLMFLTDKKIDFLNNNNEPFLVVALIFISLGITCDLLGLWCFRRAQTTVNPLVPIKAKTLVQEGIYQYTRNPMYLGMVLMLFGWGIYLGSAIALLLIVGFVFYIQIFQINSEEKALLTLFPREFSAYKQRVRRWI